MNNWTVTGRLYWVEWDDHWCANHWQELGKPVECSITCVTVGFASYEDDDILQVAATMTDGDCTAVMGILKGCITKIEEIVF